MLVDNITLTVKAGNGGNGAVTFLSNAHQPKGGPDGGNGGNGGNVYFQGTTHVTDLREFRFKKKVSAEDGVNGRRQKLFGRNGTHKTIYVPLGTRITDTASEKSYEITDTITPICVAKGGIGGRGNDEFKSATNQTPRYAEEGTLGEEKILQLELKLIADIGLAGLPNAGKSSLLAVLTNADPKIGNYPFTTLEPNIGMFGKYPIADIPGLIEGASKGRGLGVTFLKHVEKTKIIIHCIDSTTENIEETYETIRKEFGEYNPLLLQKPELILLTKKDLIDEKTIKKHQKLFEKKGKKVLTYSIYDLESIRNLKKSLEEILEPQQLS
jgi:GTP-binding protein